MKIITIEHSQKELKQFHQLAMDIDHRPILGRDASFKQLKAKLYVDEFLDKQSIFLAYENNRPVARLVARISSDVCDEHGLPYGYIGFFECLEHVQAAHGIFDAAFDWLEQRGIKNVIGPMSNSTWFAHRINLGPFVKESYVFEPKNPAYYAALWEDCGFVSAADYYSRHFDDLSLQADYLKTAYDKVCRQGIRFRMLKPLKMQQEIELTYQVAKQAFAASPYFSSVQETVFSRQYAMIRSWVKKQLFYFAFNKDNQPVGFIYALPDYASLSLAAKISPGKLAKIDVCNVYSIAVIPAYQRRGIASALSYLCYRGALKLGMHQANLCMVKEGNPIDKIHHPGGEVFRRYRLYRHKLPVTTR